MSQINLIINSFFSIFKHRNVFKDDNTRLSAYIFVASIPIFVFGLLVKVYWPNFSYSNTRGLFSIAIISIVMAILLAISEITGRKSKLFKDLTNYEKTNSTNNIIDISCILPEWYCFRFYF